MPHCCPFHPEPFWDSVTPPLAKRGAFPAPSESSLEALCRQMEPLLALLSPAPWLDLPALLLLSPFWGDFGVLVPQEG